MKNFNFLLEFKKSFKRFSKKHRTLEDDLEKFKLILQSYSAGVGKNFTIIHSDQICKIVKARMACRALRNRSLRVIYAYLEKEESFYFIELYFKGDQVNESRSLISNFIKQLSNKIDQS